MNVRPLHDRIIVQRLDEGEQKVGGIIIPDSAKEKPQHGKVIAAGIGKVKDDGTRQTLAIVFRLAVPGGDDFALLGLLFGGIGDDDPADLLFAFLDALDNDAVVQRSDVHALCSVLLMKGRPSAA